MKYRNPLANARNHGASGDGVSHWWAQRFSAIVMLALVAWLVYALTNIVGVDHDTASAFIGHPVNAALAALFIAAVFYHSRLGLQVVIEDYIHARWLEITLLLLVKLGALLGGLLAVFAILKIAFGDAR